MVKKALGTSVKTTEVDTDGASVNNILRNIEISLTKLFEKADKDMKALQKNVHSDMDSSVSRLRKDINKAASIATWLIIGSIFIGIVLLLVTT